MPTKTRTYDELAQIPNFLERYHYLRMPSQIGIATFGYDRYLNQRFYTSAQWRHIREQVIARDRGCDLGSEGHEIHDRIIIHHMNPVTAEELVQGDKDILDPDYLITTSHHTHNAIHFGDERFLDRHVLVQRRPGDTRLW